MLAAAGQVRRGREAAQPAGLTDREVEVLRLIARGYANKQVAATLGISSKTVGHHIEHIYAKAGVTTRAGATLFAMEHGLLSVGSRPDDGPPDVDGAITRLSRSTVRAHPGDRWVPVTAKGAWQRARCR